MPYSIDCSTILKPLRILPLTHFHQPLCHFNIYSSQATSSTDIQCSFLEQKILKQLRECLQSYRLTQPRQTSLLIHQQLQARCMWNQLLAYSLKIFWTSFILSFPAFFPFMLRPLFLSCVFSISYSLLFPFSLHSLFHSIHMGFCFASCWLSFLFCILLSFHSRPLACNCLFIFWLFKFFIWFLCILLSTVQPEKMCDLCHTYLFFVCCYSDLAVEPSLLSSFMFWMHARIYFDSLLLSSVIKIVLFIFYQQTTNTQFPLLFDC